MYPKFIEVHWNTIPVSYNVENISWFGDKFLYIVGQDTALDVDESYEKIKALIKDSGCLLHRADPRLDTEHPLTMNDLRTMVGEPVWNSNTGKWTLVRNYIEALEPDGIDVAFLLDAADNSTGMTAGDLIKTPLYRIKK